MAHERASESGAACPESGTPRPPVVSVLMVSYNTRKLTLIAIETLLANTSVPHEVLVVDNASRDGTAEAIRARFPEVRVIASPENLGFGRANNLAAEAARGQYLLLLNTDTEVLPGAVDKLLGFARTRSEAGIWGGRTVFADGSLNPGSCWRQLSLWSVFCHATTLSLTFRRSALINPDIYPGWRRDSVREVGFVSGCFLLIERALWDRLGGFDPAYFVYGEDADLCLRARRLGAVPLFTPDATIIHHWGGSASEHAASWILGLKAHIRIVRRHFPPLSRWAALWLLRLGPYFALARFKVPDVLVGRGGYYRDFYGTVVARRADWWEGYEDPAPASTAPREPVEA